MDKVIVTSLILLGIVIFFITWRISNFFLARRDFYINSPYALLKIKLKMAASAGLTPLILYFLVFKQISNDIKKQEIEVNNVTIIIYEEPNNKSYVLEKFYSKKLKVIDSTKYFYKVELNNTPMFNEGYVIKDSFKIFRNNHYIE